MKKSYIIKTFFLIQICFDWMKIYSDIKNIFYGTEIYFDWVKVYFNSFATFQQP